MTEAKKRLSDQTENGKCINATNCRSRVRQLTPFYTILLSALTGTKSGRSWNSRDLRKPVGRTATISLPFRRYSKHFTWSDFKQNGRKLQLLKADPNQIAQTVTPPSWFWHFWLCFLANLLHPGFQGVRGTRDQLMPGSFPAPPSSQGKGPGNEVAKCQTRYPAHARVPLPHMFFLANIYLMITFYMWIIQ